MTVRKFWMVLGRGEPVFHHLTKDDARREAERLARLHQGTTFTVLESLGHVVYSEVQWQIHADIDGNEIPF